MGCSTGWRSVGNKCVRIVSSAVSKIQETSVNNVIRIFLIPSMLISFVFMFLDGLKNAGFVYFAMALFSIVILSRKEYQSNGYGAKFNLMSLIGIPLAFGFLLLSAISPFFSLLTPAISLAVDVSFRIFIILGIAPCLEEAWRSSMFGLLGKWYPNAGFWRKNIIQAFVFAMIHTTAYGIFLGAYDTLIQLYGGLIAISSSLFAAFVFGILSGIVMDKTQNIVPSQLFHATVNFMNVKDRLFVVG